MVGLQAAADHCLMDVNVTAVDMRSTATQPVGGVAPIKRTSMLKGVQNMTVKILAAVVLSLVDVNVTAVDMRFSATQPLGGVATLVRTSMLKGVLNTTVNDEIHVSVYRTW